MLAKNGQMLNLTFAINVLWRIEIMANVKIKKEKSENLSVKMGLKSKLLVRYFELTSSGSRQKTTY